jgi:hypothetical protein
MNKFSKIVALATLVGGAAFLAQPASAAVVLLPGSGVTLSLGSDPAGIGPKNLNTTDTYDFAFNIAGSTLNVLEQVQASLLGKGGSTPELISFTLYSGLVGSGTAIGGAGPDFTAVFSSNLAPGAYYIQLGPVSAPMELLSGAVEVAAVPEPATWLSMIFGFGMLGGLMRFARRASPLNSAA